MISVDKRKERIRNLKKEIVVANQELIDKIVTAKTEEEKVALKDTIQISKAARQEKEGEIKQLRMNKTGSKFFEFTPHVGFNRKQARQFKYGKRKGGKPTRVTGRRSN